MGRQIVVDSAQNKPSQNQNRGESTSSTIFVGSLSYKSTEQTIRNFFSECGDIQDVRIAQDGDGKPKGFCHVEFSSPQAVEAAKRLSGKTLDGRQIRIDVAAEKGAGGGNRGPGGFRGGGGGGFRSGGGGF